MGGHSSRHAAAGATGGSLVPAISQGSKEAGSREKKSGEAPGFL